MHNIDIYIYINRGETKKVEFTNISIHALVAVDEMLDESHHAIEIVLGARLALVHFRRLLLRPHLHVQTFVQDFVQKLF